MKKILIALILLASAALFIFFGLRIQTVKVEGTQYYSDEEIKQSVFDRELSDNILFFAIYQKLYGINKLPFVEDIEVHYDSLHAVTLHVYDKAMSGCIQYMGQYIYFDKDGVVLQSTEEKKEGIPIVTGIHFGTFTIGEAFHVEDASRFSAIMNLSQLIAHYNIPVDRIHLSDDNITLYSGNIVAMLGKKDLYDDEVSALSSVLETAESEGLKGTIHMESFQPGDKIILKKTEKKEKNK